MKKMTEKCLSEAFAGESMAHMKYHVFSNVAEKEGFKNVSRLFRAISFAEEVHASKYAKHLGHVGDTVKNLEAALNGERFEVEEMYPAYVKVAEHQGEGEAKASMEMAMNVEKVHAELYEKALNEVKAGKDISEDPIYVCPGCGWTYHGSDVPERCPLCGKPREEFVKF